MAETSTNVATVVAGLVAGASAASEAKGVEVALLDARKAAAMCSVSRSLWLAMHNSGRIPLPVRLGRRVLWRKEELLAWIRAGCPSRQIWHAGSRPRQGYVAQEGGRL